MECAYQVNFSLPTRRRGFDSGPVRVRCVVNKVALELIFIQVIRYPLDSISHPVPHIHFHVINTLPITTSGRSLVTVLKAVLFRRAGRIGFKCAFTFFSLKCVN